jgi:hypothetical protein
MVFFLLYSQCFIVFLTIHASTAHTSRFICSEQVAFVEARMNIVSSQKTAARQALAELFRALEPQKAHWYLVLDEVPGTSERHDRFRRLFPSLGMLFSMDAELVHFVFITSDLMRWSDRKKGICSPCIKSLESFKHEYQLHFEVTTFQIFEKRLKFIRLGSWSSNHPPKTPKEMWQSKVEYCAPRLRIATVTMQFASQVGKFYNCDQTPEGEESSLSSPVDGGSVSSSSSSISTSQNCSSAIDSIFEFIDLPEHDFPLLHSLGINKTYQINTLLQELVKLKGSDDGVIKFRKKNNRPGCLLLAPTLRTSKKFATTVVQSMSESLECSEADAAEYLLDNLCKSYEESFKAVAKGQGLVVPVEKKMDAMQVEAMLAECRLGKDASRALFRHLRQFLGRSFFESEHKRREAFAGKDFPPTVNTLELSDKSMVEYWYKLPHELIKHQVNIMVKCLSDLDGLIRVDICVGGDHGGGKFRMSLKVLFRFHGKESISRLYQIASVSHPKDESQLLNDTVLKPIGESLKLIVDGGCFIVQHDNTSGNLVANFNITVTAFFQCSVLITVIYNCVLITFALFVSFL